MKISHIFLLHFHVYIFFSPVICSTINTSNKNDSDSTIITPDPDIDLPPSTKRYTIEPMLDQENEVVSVANEIGSRQAINKRTCLMTTNVCNVTSSYCHGLKCHCKKGFYKEDNVSNECYDIDECKMKVARCNRNVSKCHNTPGDYTCLCFHGYRARGRHTCVVFKETSKEDRLNWKVWIAWALLASVLAMGPFLILHCAKSLKRSDCDHKTLKAHDGLSKKKLSTHSSQRSILKNSKSKNNKKRKSDEQESRKNIRLSFQPTDKEKLSRSEFMTQPSKLPFNKASIRPPTKIKTLVAMLKDANKTVAQEKAAARKAAGKKRTTRKAKKASTDTAKNKPKTTSGSKDNDKDNDSSSSKSSKSTRSSSSSSGSSSSTSSRSKSEVRSKSSTHRKVRLGSGDNMSGRKRNASTISLASEFSDAIVENLNVREAELKESKKSEKYKSLHGEDDDAGNVNAKRNSRRSSSEDSDGSKLGNVNRAGADRKKSAKEKVIKHSPDGHDLKYR